MIELRHVFKQFTGQTTVNAVSDVSLTVHGGEIFGIIGMSGAGKSTLIRCINRLDTPTGGEILIDGKNVLTMSESQLRATRRDVSMIFQQFNLLMQKTVAKNVRYPLEIAGVPKKDADRRVTELLEIVGLTEKANAYPIQLSGGQKQRVAIARALASNPKVLLCDEATSALDPMTTQSILALLEDINKKMGITIVLITHEMAVIRQICTKVAIIDDGVIVEEGTVNEVFTHTRSAAGRRLFGVVSEQPEADAFASGAVRIVFDGEQAAEPLLSKLILSTGIPVNILAANVNKINGKQYGQMIISRPGAPEESAKLIEGLRSLGLSAEEVESA